MPFGGEARCQLEYVEVGVAAQTALLRTVRLKPADVDAAGSARMTAGTLWQVQMSARAAEAARECRAVQLSQVWCSRVQDKVLRRALGEVAAGVWQGLEQTDAVRAHGAILGTRMQETKPGKVCCFGYRPGHADTGPGQS